MSFSRRDFLKTSTGVAAGSLVPPSIGAEKPVLTLSVEAMSPLYAIKDIAEDELDLTLNLVTGEYSDRLQHAVLQSTSCHLFEFRSNNMRALWRSNAAKPIDINRLSGWSELHETLVEVENLAQQGSTSTFGALPNSELYLAENGSFGSTLKAQATHMPIYLGNESFAYAADQTVPGGEESWSWLLDDAYRGKVSLSNSPATVYYALALAAIDNGFSDEPLIADPATPGPYELDALYEFALECASKGQFSSFWSTALQLVEPFLSGEISLANLVTQDIPLMRSQGVKLQQAAPKEGFLGQSKVLFLSPSVSGEEENNAYRFLDWLSRGTAGVEFSHYGYSCLNQQRTKELMSANNWGYWYEGQPTSEPIYDPSGNLVADSGETRAGGSFIDRFQNIGLWAGAPIPNTEQILVHWRRLISRVLG